MFSFQVYIARGMETLVTSYIASIVGRRVCCIACMRPIMTNTCTNDHHTMAVKDIADAVHEFTYIF